MPIEAKASQSWAQKGAATSAELAHAAKQCPCMLSTCTPRAPRAPREKKRLFLRRVLRAALSTAARRVVVACASRVDASATSSPSQMTAP
jgi:hypothetical protein